MTATIPAPANAVTSFETCDTVVPPTERAQSETHGVAHYERLLSALKTHRLNTTPAIRYAA